MVEKLFPTRSPRRLREKKRREEKRRGEKRREKKRKEEKRTEEIRREEKRKEENAELEIKNGAIIERGVNGVWKRIVLCKMIRQVEISMMMSEFQSYEIVLKSK